MIKNLGDHALLLIVSHWLLIGDRGQLVIVI